MKKNNLFKNIKRAHKEIWQIRKSAYFASIIKGFLNSILPVINIFFLAIIVESLETGKNRELLYLLVVTMLASNLIVGVLSQYVGKLNLANYFTLKFVEQHKVNKILTSLDYNLLESTEVDTAIRKYRESKELTGGHLCFITETYTTFIAIITQIAFTIILLFPLFGLLMTTSGNTFIQTPWFTLVTIVAIAILSLVNFLLSKFMSTISYNKRNKLIDLSTKLNYYNDLVMEYKNGKDIRIFGIDKLISNLAGSELLSEGEKIRGICATKSGISGSLNSLISVFLMLGIYLLVGLKALTGGIEISDVVKYCGSLLLLVQSVMSIFNFFATINYHCKTLGNYFNVIDIKNDVKNGKQVESNYKYVIEFKNVSYKYENSNEYALKNLSFSFESGEKIAIVGQNGSGKTTIIKLLLKLYKNYEGEILLNGVNISTIDDKSYIKLFSVIFQDYKLLSLTVEENIVATASYKEEKFLESINKANANELLSMLPNGRKTYLYKNFCTNGIDISGGESQRIAAARSFFKDCKCIILDEPTASLDPLAESNFYNYFSDTSSDKSVIFISHRMSSCLFCDRIIVLDNGKIVQDGLHSTLVQDKKSKYYELWKAQIEFYS